MIVGVLRVVGGLSVLLGLGWSVAVFFTASRAYGVDVATLVVPWLSLALGGIFVLAAAQALALLERMADALDRSLQLYRADPTVRARERELLTGGTAGRQSHFGD